MGDALCFIGTWLVSYWIHSSLLLGLAAFLDQSGEARHPLRFFAGLKSSLGTRELLWRVAMIGGIVSATLVCTTDVFRSLGNHDWQLGRLAESYQSPADSSIVSEGKALSNQSDLTYALAERTAMRSMIALGLIACFGGIWNLLWIIVQGFRTWVGLRYRIPFEATGRLESLPTNESDLLVSPKTSLAFSIDGPVCLPNGEIVIPTLLVVGTIDNEWDFSFRTGVSL